MQARDELRDDLMAVLATARELSPDSDADLATIFLERSRPKARRQDTVGYWRVPKRLAVRVFVAMVWLGAIAILAGVPYYYYTHDSDVVDGYYSQTVPTVLVVALMLTLVVCAVNATRWSRRRVRITVERVGGE